jgi:ABC-type branched-subunit amino acid transport system substrate-binding protein
MFKTRWLLVFIVLISLALLVPACGDNNEEPTSIPTNAPIVTATATPTPTTAETPTPTSSSTGPVKIGGIASWSGPAAASSAIADPMIKLVEQQVKDMGGILGGRDVKVIRYDNRASVAEATAGAQKLMYDDKVSAICWGGVSGAEGAAISTFAEQNHILHVDYGAIDNAAQKKYSLSGTVGYTELVGPVVDLANKVLKPKTAAYLATDMADSRERVPLYQAGMATAGTKTVYEQYVQLGTADMTSFLTKIKYANPDLLIIDSGNNELYMTIAQQMQELGGWGTTKVLGLAPVETAMKMAGAQGWYCDSLWVAGLKYPGAIKFQNDYQAMFGRLPTATMVYYYNGLWAAIYAIKIANTDTDLEKIAYTARFSGLLEWDTPMGHAHYTAESNGYPQLHPTITQVQNKQLVAIDIPE